MLVLKLPGLPLPVALDSISYVEGNGNYSWFYFTNQAKFLSATTLKWVEAQLPGFIRVHKSALINPTQVVSMTRTGPRSFCLRMSNGVELLVSRRRTEFVRHQLAGQAYFLGED